LTDNASELKGRTPLIAIEYNQALKTPVGIESEQEATISLPGIPASPMLQRRYYQCMGYGFALGREVYIVGNVNFNPLFRLNIGTSTLELQFVTEAGK